MDRLQCSFLWIFVIFRFYRFLYSEQNRFQLFHNTNFHVSFILLHFGSLYFGLLVCCFLNLEEKKEIELV